MQNASTRHFNAASVPGLSAEARKAVNAAFEAMSTWRTETTKNNEKNVEEVIEKMAAAGRALGWPERVVESAREQMQAVSKMQIQMMDYMMDAWEEQIKSPNPSALLSRLNSLPGFPGLGRSAHSPDALNPFQAYMQIAEQWQKAWGNAMSFWARPDKSS
jgi:hypothetical protein